MKPVDQSARRSNNLLPQERRALEAFVHRLIQWFADDLLRVVLFGSKARGDFGAESDLDLLVVAHIHPETYREAWSSIADIAWGVELEFGVVLSVIVKSEQDFAKMRRHGLLLARNIESEGIDLWTSPQSAPISASG